MSSAFTVRSHIPMPTVFPVERSDHARTALSWAALFGRYTAAVRVPSRRGFVAASSASMAVLPLAGRAQTAAGTWTQAAPLPNDRSEDSVAAMDSTLSVAGGYVPADLCRAGSTRRPAVDHAVRVPTTIAVVSAQRPVFTCMAAVTTPPPPSADQGERRHL